MQKSCIYARTSTKIQAEKKTISSQIRELKEFCQEKGFEVVKIIQDDGVSGATLDRPGIEELKKTAKDGLFDVVVFHTEDRVARDDEGIDAVLLERELNKAGVEVIYKNSSEDPLTRGFKRLIASYERKQIKERMNRGRLDRLKRGAMPGGFIVFGYNYKKSIKEGYRWGEYTINKEQAKTVNLIFNLYIKTNNTREVVRALTNRGVKPQKNGDVWRRSTVKKVLKNTAYTGRAYRNKTRSIKTENNKYIFRLKDKKEWIEIEVPAIISKDKFYKVQEIRKQKSKKPAFRTTPYLLSGLVICKECGSTYSGEFCKGKRYYRCNNRHRNFPKPKTCNAKMVVADDLEKVVWQEMSKALETPEILMKRIFDLTKDTTKDIQLLNEEGADLLKAKDKIKTSRKKLLDLYTEADTQSKEAILERLNGLSEKETALSKQISNVEIRLTQLKQKPTFIKNLKHFCKLNRAQLKTLSFEKRKELLYYVIERVLYNSDTKEVEIIGHIPIKPSDRKSYFIQQGVMPELVGIENTAPFFKGLLGVEKQF